MEGVVKVKVEHVIVGSGGSDSGNGDTKLRKKASGNSNAYAKKITGFVKRNLPKVAKIKVLADAGREVAGIFTSDFASWSGDTRMNEIMQGTKFYLNFAKNLLNTIGLTKMFYKYNAEIAKYNTQANFIRERSGNSSLTNGSRGTRN